MYLIENLIITTANQLLITCKERLNTNSQQSQLLIEINEKLEHAYFDTIQQLFKKHPEITTLEFSNKMTRALPKFLFQKDINYDPSIDGDDEIKGGLVQLDKDEDNPEGEKLYWTRNIFEEETA